MDDDEGNRHKRHACSAIRAIHSKHVENVARLEKRREWLLQASSTEYLSREEIVVLTAERDSWWYSRSAISHETSLLQLKPLATDTRLSIASVVFGYDWLLAQRPMRDSRDTPCKQVVTSGQCTRTSSSAKAHFHHHDSNKMNPWPPVQPDPKPVLCQDQGNSLNPFLFKFLWPAFIKMKLE